MIRSRPPERVSAGTAERGRRTREHIVAVAERLFGERGLRGVSLREINQAAGQKNPSSIHYHFTGREGLVRAIVAKHRPRLERRHRELLAALRERDADDVHGLVDAMVRPLGELLEAGASERAFIKIWAELISDPRLPVAKLVTLNDPPINEIARLLLELLDIGASRAFTGERILIVMEQAAHAIADRARLIDARDRRRVAMPTRIFVDDLVRTVSAAVAAPARRRR